MRITPHANCRDYIWGGCQLENGGNSPKTNFKQVLDHLSGFENYTFFNFQKKFFSLHPTGIYLSVQYSVLIKNILSYKFTWMYTMKLF